MAKGFAFVEGIKDTFTKPELMKTGAAFLGGAIGGVGHLAIVENVPWFDTPLKRGGLATAAGTLLAHFVGEKWPNAGRGLQGAMGAAVGLEVYNWLFAKGAAPAATTAAPKTSGIGSFLRGLGFQNAFDQARNRGPMPDAFPPAERPLMSGTYAFPPNNPAAAFGGTSVLTSRGLGRTTVLPGRRQSIG